MSIVCSEVTEVSLTEELLKCAEAVGVFISVCSVVLQMSTIVGRVHCAYNVVCAMYTVGVYTVLT